jgi:uncharacterized protein (DUF302 family)
MFHYTVDTSKTVEEAIESLEENLKKEQFGLLWQFDIKEKLQDKGLEFDQSFRVLEVCNPFDAQRVLEENQLVGYFLPCKIVVYESDNGTKIGMPKPTALVDLTGDESVKRYAEEIEERLIECINQSK